VKPSNFAATKLEIAYMVAVNNFFRPAYSMLYMLLLISLISCSKKNDSLPEEPDPDDTTNTGNFYKLMRFENLMIDTTGGDSNPTAPKPTVFFSLEDKKEVTASYQKTNRWDLAFGGLYNSFLSANNGSDAQNYGAGNNASGGILILSTNFNEVIDVPNDNQFKTGKDLIGTDASGAFGNGTGWYLYDFAGDIMGDGSYNKQHVAYALSNTRTLIVRTAKGNYAKIKMISCYKDAFLPEQWFRNTPHMFFTFEYVLVPKGSTKFEIKP
jgi:hypothetical protein